jgi:hypothetical protein
MSLKLGAMIHALVEAVRNIKNVVWASFSMTENSTPNRDCGWGDEWTRLIVHTHNF